MRRTILASLLLIVTACLATSASGLRSAEFSQRGYQANSLCAAQEPIIFSCVVRRSAKIVSLCGSKNLTKENGYLQYRFGVPDKIELEFPRTQTHTQEQFTYSHYFRYQVDLTEINFTVDGYQY